MIACQLMQRPDGGGERMMMIGRKKESEKGDIQVSVFRKQHLHSKQACTSSSSASKLANMQRAAFRLSAWLTWIAKEAGGEKRQRRISSYSVYCYPVCQTASRGYRQACKHLVKSPACFNRACCFTWAVNCMCMYSYVYWSRWWLLPDLLLL